MAVTEIVIVTVAILRVLTWSPMHEEAGNHVFQTEAEMLAVWEADGGTKENLPQVDWEKEMVLAAFMGQQNTGGFAIEIEEVIKAEAEGKTGLVIAVRRTLPSPDGAVTMAITYPQHVVVVPKMENIKDLKWVDAEADKAKLDAIREHIQPAP